jgi:hypothetical protein
LGGDFVKARDFQPIGGHPWVLVCTSHFEATVTQFTEVLGLKIVSQGIPAIDTQFTRYVQLTMPDGCVVEVVEPRDDLRPVYQGLIYSIAVSDVYLAKASMETEGIVFTTDSLGLSLSRGSLTKRPPPGSRPSPFCWPN